MSYTGYYDAISLALAVKLLIFSMAAAFSDAWHPAFYAAALNPNLVLLAAAVFIAMLLAIVNLLALSLAIFITEATRRIAAVMAGACGGFHLLALALFANNLAAASSPWLLAMLANQLTVLAAHEILTLMKRLPDCPVYKLAASCEMALLCIFCVSLKQWWLVDSAKTSLELSGKSYGLFSLPSVGPVKVVQGCAMLALVMLLVLLALSLLAVAADRKWLAANPLGESIPGYLSIGLLCTALACTVVASAAYASATYYSNSMLAAVCLMDAGLGLTYQLFSDKSLPAV